MKVKVVIALVVVNVALIVGLVCVNSSLRTKIRAQNAEIEANEQKLADINREMERFAREISEANARIDAAISKYVDGVGDAHREHGERLNEIHELETSAATDGATQDWLYEPVPADVCELLDRYTQTVHTDAD